MHTAILQTIVYAKSIPVDLNEKLFANLKTFKSALGRFSKEKICQKQYL